MRRRYLNICEYAKCIAEFSVKKEELETKIKGIRLPTVELVVSEKGSQKGRSPLMKNPQKLVREDFDSKRVSFIRSAYETYKCCQKQDLYLFQFQKVYIQNKHLLKGVARWRLPKKMVVEERLKSVVSELSRLGNNYKDHTFTWLLHVKRFF